ncbi:muramoyltetrapeptide carboxypeptidase [Novosphingobium sp. CF614]|uniref:S66 peptidase family protein n=1 Tax=Novosphingobium sp. CF614 TaxID=1884364 RepID=UPI0008E29EFC|nr:LD-carboxypeptidase [Novosphingobium sp. CF614]SFF91862.1 muramoyltetrapeptide carboxypeptidase [Novosphingobium sp. CF614]
MLTRRQAVAGLGAAALSLTTPSRGAQPPRSGPPAPVKPPRLREGDVLGLVAPAGFVGDRFGLDEIEATVRAMGLVPRPAPHLLEREGYLAGSDQTRARDVMAMFTDDGVRAIMAVRGGWGSARLLPYLDFQAIARRPKLFAGFSDNTALHLALAARTGVASIHGPNAAASWPPAAWEAFRQIAFEGDMPTYSVPAYDGPNLAGHGGALRIFRGGKARGRLLGGNLSVLAALVGTPYLPDFTGAILFLEDTNEAEYRIDRMLTQLALGGVLGKVAGIVFGQCTGCEDPDRGFSGFTIYEVLDRQVADLGIPAFQGAMIGHVAAQVSVPVGIMAEIDADAGTIRMLEPAVS